MAKTVFENGNPALGVPGTVVTAEFLNATNNHRHTGKAEDGAGAIDYAADTGAANAYAIALTPALTEHITGMPICFKATNANTGASTLNVNGLGVKTIKRLGGSGDLSQGDILLGAIVCVVYDGTDYQLLSSAGEGSISALPVRQTVLDGPCDSNGYANFLSAGSGLTINIAATSHPIRLSFAAGFGENGPIDYMGSISADTTVPNLTASAVCYLYVDRSVVDSSITLGFSTVAPVDQFASPSSPAADQHWFDLSTMKMKRWTGSAWEEKHRIFIGEVVTGVSSVTSSVTYALRGEYVSGDTSLQSAGVATNFNHNIGTKMISVEAIMVCQTAQDGYSAGDIAPLIACTNTAYEIPNAKPWRISSSCAMSTLAGYAGNGWWLQNATKGAFTSITPSYWKQRITVRRSWD